MYSSFTTLRKFTLYFTCLDFSYEKTPSTFKKSSTLNKSHLLYTKTTKEVITYLTHTICKKLGKTIAVMPSFKSMSHILQWNSVFMAWIASKSSGHFPLISKKIITGKNIDMSINFFLNITDDLKKIIYLYNFFKVIC